MIFDDYFSLIYLILVHFSIFSSYGKSFWSFVNVIVFCVGAGISTLMSISDWFRTVYFPSKDGKDAVCKGKKWTERCLFPNRVGMFPLYLLWQKYFSLVCFLTWRANNYVSRQGKSKNRRNENTRKRERDSYNHFDYQLTVPIATNCLF